MSCGGVPNMGLLLHDIKISLHVTWDDQETNERLTGFIQDGIAYLDNKLGEPGSYQAPGLPRTLLKEYVRYARDEALDVFENNYQSLILAAVNDKGVGEYGKAVESAAPP